MAEPVQQTKLTGSSAAPVATSTESELTQRVQQAYQEAYAKRTAELKQELAETSDRVGKKLDALTQRLSERQPTAEPGPHSQIALHTSRNGTFQEQKQYFRLDTNGELQVWAASGKRASDGKPEYTWQNAADPKSQPAAKQFACLYVSNGKIYDSSGREVKSLGTAGNARVNAEHIVDSIDLAGAGKVCGLKSNQLNALTLNGKRIVFTEGPPPHSIQREVVPETQIAGARLPTSAHRVCEPVHTPVHTRAHAAPEHCEQHHGRTILPQRPHHFRFWRRG